MPSAKIMASRTANIDGGCAPISRNITPVLDMKTAEIGTLASAAKAPNGYATIPSDGHVPLRRNGSWAAVYGGRRRAASC